MGIGNLLLQDEGVGVHAINALRERYIFPQGVELMDGGTMGLDLLPDIEGRDILMLVDAVDFKKSPGHISVIEDDNIKRFLDMKFSVHQIGLPDMLFAASLMGIVPKKLCLVGIQPHTIDTGIELSDELRPHFETLLSVIIDKLKSWGIEIEARTIKGALA